MCDRQPFTEHANGALIVALHQSHHLVIVFERLASDDVTNAPSHVDRQRHSYNLFFFPSEDHLGHIPSEELRTKIWLRRSVIN